MTRFVPSRNRRSHSIRASVLVFAVLALLSLASSAADLRASAATRTCIYAADPSLIPHWAKVHDSPKPLAPDVIAAIETLPEFPDRKTRILVPIAAGASALGVDAVIARARQMHRGVELHMWVNGVPTPILDKARASQGKVSLVVHFLGPNLRSLYQDGYVQLVSGYLSQFSQRVREGRPDYQFDAVLTRVSAPNEKGAVSLGANCDMVCTVLEMQPNALVIGEVNSKIPVTYGRRGMNTIAKNRLSAAFKSESKLAYPTEVPLTEVEKSIGVHIASLIDSGATIQIGIGNVFGGLPAGLRSQNRSDLKIWTEMMGDVLQEVMTDGIATEAVIGFGFGSQKFYDWLNRNPKVKLAPTEVVNDVAVIAKKKRFHAVNTALQVSLSGEVNATFGPPQRGRISSPGGQVEFLSGASLSKGGKSIIAIRSTATVEGMEGKIEISTIVPRTYPARDGTPSAYVSHVVTEYGVADIRGKSEREKAIALMNVANPKFRKQLFERAIYAESPDHIVGLTAADLHEIHLGEGN